MDLYSRQEGIVPSEIESKHLLICGVGGIGSHFALLAALAGFGIITLVDDDVLEESNLNRTLYTYEDIGKPKVDALRAHIEARRPVCDLFTHQEKVTINHCEGIDYFVDCTDKLFIKDNIAPTLKVPYMKLGYDGDTITFDINNPGATGWGDQEDGYRTVPSYIVPPIFLAAMGLHQVIFGDPKLKALSTSSVGEVIKNFLQGK